MKSTLRQKITSVLMDEILTGRYPPDAPMPTEFDLCARFSASRPTVRLALGDLEQRNLIYRIHGRGTYAHPVNQRSVKPLGLLMREPEKLANPFFTDLIRGANGYLMTIGSHLSVVHQSPLHWSSDLANGLSGVIVNPVESSEEELLKLERLGLAYVMCINSDLPGPVVSFDVETAAQNLTRGLIDLGHRRFGLLSGHNRHSDRQKKLGISAALKAAGIDFAAVPDYMTNYDQRLGRQAAQDLFAKRPDITAVIATDDVLGLVAVQVAQQLGRRVPFDVSVVGFNDLSISALFEPALSTVHFPIIEAGRVAAEMLCLHTLKGTPLRNVELKHALVWRQSTGPAPVAA